MKQRRDPSVVEVEVLPMTTLTLPARLESLPCGLALVVQCALAAGFSSKRVTEIELAVEEALANICLYAYPDSSGEVEVRCTWDETRHFVIELSDAGLSFDVLARPTPDLTGDAFQRALGGLGIPLIRALMDHVTYHREEARNILRLIALLPR